MSKLRLKINNSEIAQEKHNSYLELGFKLKQTIQDNGLIRRIYIKSVVL